MTRIERIKKKLVYLKPQYLEISDQTNSHRGHFGTDTSFETHLTIRIYGEIFKNKNKIDQHRLINEALKEEFDTGLHALTINILNELPIYNSNKEKNEP